MSILKEHRLKIWKNWYHIDIAVEKLHGGTPLDPNIVEGWIKSKLSKNHPTEHILDLIRETMNELGISKADLADEKKLAQVISETGRKQLSGFKRDDKNVLFFEGRQLKAMLKEAANIAYPWPQHKLRGKSWKKVIAEHVFVVEDRISLDVDEADGVETRFVTTRFGSSIKREEILRNVRMKFTVMTDLDLKKDQWYDMLTYAEKQGVGASRSQGFGTFSVEAFDAVEPGELAS